MEGMRTLVQLDIYRGRGFITSLIRPKGIGLLNKKHLKFHQGALPIPQSACMQETARFLSSVKNCCAAFQGWVRGYISGSHEPHGSSQLDFDGDVLLGILTPCTQKKEGMIEFGLRLDHV